MATNMLCPGQISATDEYREGYERTFRDANRYGDYYCPACRHEQSGHGAAEAVCEKCGGTAKRVS